MKRFLFFIASLNVYAYCTNAGGPATFIDANSVRCFSDAFFSGGFVSIDATMGPDELSTLRYGPAFSYTYNTQPGFYTIKLTFVDPNSVRNGQRLFVVSVNGAPTQQIDIFAQVGQKKEYTLKLFAISNGSLAITFRGIVGNALVNKIEYDRTNPYEFFDAVNKDEFYKKIAQPVGDSLHWLPLLIMVCPEKDKE